MKFCTQCGTALEDAAAFCPGCGTPTNTISLSEPEPTPHFCVGCGAPLTPDEKFCTKCGTATGPSGESAFTTRVKPLLSNLRTGETANLTWPQGAKIAGILFALLAILRIVVTILGNSIRIGQVTISTTPFGRFWSDIQFENISALPNSGFSNWSILLYSLLAIVSFLLWKQVKLPSKLLKVGVFIASGISAIFSFLALITMFDFLGRSEGALLFLNGLLTLSLLLSLFASCTYPFTFKESLETHHNSRKYWLWLVFVISALVLLVINEFVWQMDVCAGGGMCWYPIEQFSIATFLGSLFGTLLYLAGLALLLLSITKQVNTHAVESANGEFSELPTPTEEV